MTRREPSLPGGPWVPLACALVAVVWRLPYFLEPLGRDQGIFATVADGLFAGRRLYVQVWDHKPPLAFVPYALAHALSPAGAAGVHAVDVLAAALGAALLAAVTRRLSPASPASTAPALAAGLVYALHANFLSFGAYWSRAQPEHFADVPALGAFALVTGALGAPTRWRFALAGALVGAACQVKLSAAPVLLLPCIAALTAPGDRRTRGAYLGATLGGFVALHAAVFAGMAAWGAARDYLDAVWRFNLEHRATARRPITLGILPLLATPHYDPPSFAPVLALGFGGALVAWRREAHPAERLGALWVLLAYAEVIVQRRFWHYHYIPTVMPLALCAGTLVRWGTTRGSPGRRTAALALALVALAEVPLFVEAARYYHGLDLAGRIAGRVTAAQYQDRLTQPSFRPSEVRAVASWLAGAAPGRPVLVVGFESLLYHLAQRQPATRFVYDYPLYTGSPRARRRAFLTDFDARPPARVVVGLRDQGELEPETSLDQLRTFNGLRRRLAGYRQVGVMGTWLLLERP